MFAKKFSTHSYSVIIARLRSHLPLETSEERTVHSATSHYVMFLSAEERIRALSCMLKAVRSEQFMEMKYEQKD